jgi:hypothetical protein
MLRALLVVAPALLAEVPVPGPWLSAGGHAAVLIHLPRGWRVGPEASYLLPINLDPVPPRFERALTSPAGHVGLAAFKAF